MAIVRIKYAGDDHKEKNVTVAIRTKAPSRSFFAEIGAPKKPQSSWQCGTDLVWPVLRIVDHPEIEVVKDTFVCRHEIEAGD